MNDPNGLVYYKGKYHLFYQYAPGGFLISRIHWGHAISTDLLRWDDLPVALYPDDALGDVYSGSAVVDAKNSSGLCTGTMSADGSCLVAIFTHSGGTTGGQKQSLAYSLDDGLTWQMYNGNPVLEPDAGQKDFRDPKVFWHDSGNRWVMALAARDRVRFYSSPDLRDWTHLSDFVKDGSDHTGTWECPDLFPIPIQDSSGAEKWVLVVSVFSGGPQEGSGVRYFVGDFDGIAFTSETPLAAPKWLDFGSDFYAWQSWSGLPGKSRIGIAWMNNWAYAASIPTRPWQGAMTVPRELELRGDTGEGFILEQKPAGGLESLRTAVLFEADNMPLSGDYPLPESAWSDRMEILATIESGDAGKTGLYVQGTGGMQLGVGYDVTGKKLFMERVNSEKLGIPSNFPLRQEAPLALSGTKLILHIIIDRSSVEVIADNGRVSLSGQFFPVTGKRKIGLYAAGGSATIDKLTVSGLSSVWAR
jgi:fructan beta-fructosidase